MDAAAGVSEGGFRDTRQYRRRWLQRGQVWRLQRMEVYLLWHMRPLEGQKELDPEMNHIETDDKLCGVYSTQA